MTAKEVSHLTGVSVRTLHHYDEIGLLVPCRNPENQYRIYSEENLDTLQQILFFKECGFSLGEIQKILSSGDFKRENTFKLQKEYLVAEKKRIDDMLDLLERSMKALKGEIAMSKEEKFTAFKENLVKENEKKFGKEIRALYGEEQVVKSNAHVKSLSLQDYNRGEELSKEIANLIKTGLKSKDSQTGKSLAKAHKEWLKIMWGSGVEYSKEAHLSMLETYRSDERFGEYYGGPQELEYLCESVKKYL